MLNSIKTETRLSFIQFIFSSFFSNSTVEENMTEFENYFYKLSIPSIKQNKDININFNKNFFKKLTTSYAKFIKYHNIEEIINSLIKFDRKYKNQWRLIV